MQYIGHILSFKLIIFQNRLNSFLKYNIKNMSNENIVEEENIEITIKEDDKPKVSKKKKE